MLIKIKLLLGVIAIVSFSIVLPAEALLQKQENESASLLPEGKGKELVASVCVQCHALDIVTTKRKSEGEWKETVNDMISRGMNISADEAASVAGYLGGHFSPESRPAAAASDSREVNKSSFPPDGPGKELLMSKCYQCHNEGMWKNLKQDKRGWEGALYRMIGRGALWTEDEIETMAQYLATVLGPASTDPRSPRRQ